MKLKRYTSVISEVQIEQIKDACYNFRKKFKVEPSGAQVLRIALDMFFDMKEAKQFELIKKEMDIK